MYINRIAIPCKNSSIRSSYHVPEPEEEIDENGNLLNDDYYSDEYDSDGTPKELDYRPAYYCDCFRDYELYNDEKDDLDYAYNQYDTDDLEIKKEPEYKYADKVTLPFAFDTDLPKIKLVKNGKEIYTENFYRKLDCNYGLSHSYKCEEAINDGYSVNDIANIYHHSILKRDDMKHFDYIMMDEGINALRAGFPIKDILDAMQYTTLNSTKNYETYDLGSLMFVLNNKDYKADFIKSTPQNYQYYDSIGAQLFEELKTLGKTPEEALSIVNNCRLKAPDGTVTTNKKLSKLAMKIVKSKNEPWDATDTKVLKAATKFYPETELYDTDYMKYNLITKMVEKGISSQDILEICN